MSRKNLFRMRSNDQDEDDSASNSSANDENLTFMAEYDDLIRQNCGLIQNSKDIFKSYKDFINETINVQKEWHMAVEECKRLKARLDEKTSTIGDLESKLDNARRLMDEEMKYSRSVEEERNVLAQQISKTKELLFGKYSGHLPDAHKQFEFLNEHDNLNQFNDAEEHTSGSILANYSYSRSEDDLDVSYKKWHKPRKSTDFVDAPNAKKQKTCMSKNVEISNNEKICATTTISVGRNGPITATSVIESIPIIIDQVVPTNVTYQLEQRKHNFQTKKFARIETCGVCSKKIHFGKSIVKCKECRVICHSYCKEKVPLPCIPCAHTPLANLGKSKFGVISDHAPLIPPMIPAILIHCTKEIEARGLDTVGLYRISGAELEVKLLKEKLLKARGTPNLKDFDMPTLCSVVKNFLRSLDDALIPQKSCRELIASISAKDLNDIMPNIEQVLADMPQANRDTLAYLLLHMKKISESEACCMPVTNLAKIFAVTFMFTFDVGKLQNVCADIKDRVMVLEFLLNVPANYYANLLSESTKQKTSTHLQQTPSTDSLFQWNTNRNVGVTPRTIKRIVFPTPEGTK